MFITDSHVRSTNPVSRRGSYASDILAKLQWCANKAIIENCDSLIHGGDLLDSPVIGLETFFQLCSIIKDFGRPWYQVLGNHDVFGCNSNTVCNSLIGFLPYFVSNVKTDQTIELDSSLQLEQYHYSTALDADFQLRETNGPTIHVVHAMLVREPFMGNYTLLSDVRLPATDAPQVILVGHYHPGWSDYQVDNCTFANPGALGRLAASWHDLHRKPKCLIIEWSGSSFKLIPYEVPHVPTDEAFDVRQAQRIQEEALVLTDFVASLSESTIVQGSIFSITQYLDTIEREGQTNMDVIREIRRRLEHVA